MSNITAGILTFQQTIQKWEQARRAARYARPQRRSAQIRRFQAIQAQSYSRAGNARKRATWRVLEVEL